MIAVCCAFLRGEKCQDSRSNVHFVKFMHLIHKLHFFPINTYHNKLIFVPAYALFSLNRST